MNANASTRLLSMALAVGLASTASGMDVSPPPPPAADGTPALRLPAFLDIARLPDLQDAWRLHSSPPVQPTSAAPVAAGEDEAALATAREALTRAEQISREAAAVRERAEELSRRFGAEAAAADTAAAPAAEPPTETAAIEGATPAATQPQPVEHVLAPAEDAAASEPAAPPPNPQPKNKKAAAADDAPVVEEMATKPAKAGKRSGDGVTARQITQVTAAKPSTPGLVVFEDSPTQPEHDPSKMLPTELRSFGWNAQP